LYNSQQLKRLSFLFFLLSATNGLVAQNVSPLKKQSGNLVFPGWYADPEGEIFNNTYWIFPTYSAPFDEQVFFDAFSSKDMVNWIKHSKVLDTTNIKWARRALWAPSVV